MIEESERKTFHFFANLGQEIIHSSDAVELLAGLLIITLLGNEPLAVSVGLVLIADGLRPCQSRK
jgi:hypothetical protein